LRARIEQRHNFATRWIKRSQISALVDIATCAGQGQISFLSSTTVSERDDMVYRVRFRSVFLMNKTVFTSAMSAIANY
jgi:hypothetical protein